MFDRIGDLNRHRLITDLDLLAEGLELKYSEMDSIEAGLRFKTIGGVIVETTGATLNIDVRDLFVHEVSVVEGTGQDYKYFHNLDSAQKL